MNAYDYIANKIIELKKQYPTLRSRTDDYVFSALCVKANVYKNPSLVLNESDLTEMIVDGWSDGGADILLNDPNPESSDLIIGQSKFYKTITSEQVLNALRKMADFYKDMTAGHYERFNPRVQSRFRRLHAEIGDESKIRFVFYTSAPKNRIDLRRIEKKFRELFTDAAPIEVDIFFAADLEDEIKESLLRKPTVEYGKIRIDEANNYLAYGDDAAIVNVSALSIKKLYAEHKTNLLALNLRYHIKERKRDGVDHGIKTTIENNPEFFWLKNNGITIICDEFRIDGTIVHLRNFSIVNGGQTTFQLYNNDNVNATKDFYLPCKIIRNVCTSKDEKAAFSLAIAQAANSQKPITQDDLKVNTPEQISFAREMREVGVLYKTKRGEEVDKKYRDAYLNTNLAEVGKLCMAAIFQEPCKSRNKPSESYNVPGYYAPIFTEKPVQVAKICRELLYINHYFKKVFQSKFEAANKTLPDADNKIPFANNARTICIAFVTLAARYHQGNITDQSLTAALASAQSDSSKSDFYKVFRDLGDMQCLLPIKLYTDAYDAALKKLFKAIIKAGTQTYVYARKHDKNLTARNFLQNDKNYYAILNDHWDTLRDDIHDILSDV